MGYLLEIYPNPLEVGQGFNVFLHIGPTEAKLNDRYTLVVTDPSGPVVIDVHTDEITTLKHDGSADLTFESVNGFQAIGHFTFFAVNESDPLNPIPSTQIEFDVVLPAPVVVSPPAPAPAPTPPAPPVVPPAVAAPVVPAPVVPAPATPSAWRFMSNGVSWITACVVVLAALVIGMGILSMPYWAVWLIAKNGNSQNGQSPPAKVEQTLPPGALDIVKGLISSGKGQTINPICTNNCSATGNLFNPESAPSKP